jgi:hypothetical protein
MRELLCKISVGKTNHSHANRLGKARGEVKGAPISRSGTFLDKFMCIEPGRRPALRCGQISRKARENLPPPRLAESTALLNGRCFGPIPALARAMQSVPALAEHSIAEAA